MAAAGGEPKTPKVGEAFSPYKRFLSVMLPKGLLANSVIGAPAKILLARLYMYAGKKDWCNPSIETLAGELGVTIDTISRLMRELVDAGFIRRERRARAVAICRLLWHSSLASSLRPSDSAMSSNHARPMIPQGCGDDSTLSQGSDSAMSSNALKDEEEFSEEVHEVDHSSSSSTAVTVERKTRKDKSLSDENLEALRAKWKSAYFGNGFTSEGIQKPTRKQVLRAVARFERDMEEMVVYLEHFPSRKLKPKSYEYLFTDVAEYWLDIKTDLEKAVAEDTERKAQNEAAARQREEEFGKHRALHWACSDKGWKSIHSSSCTNCAGYGRNPITEAVCSCASGVEYERRRTFCEKCHSNGFRTLAKRGMEIFYEWCDCQHASAKREKNPDFVESNNAEFEQMYAKQRERQKREFSERLGRVTP